MTPMWREMMRQAFALEDNLKTPEKRRNMRDWRRLMAEGAVRAHVMGAARAFDMREVEGLCYATSTELREAAHFAPATVARRENPHARFTDDASKQSLFVDVGERTCLPSPATWVEFADMAILFSVSDVWSDPPFTPIPDGTMVVEMVTWWRDGTTGQRAERKVTWCGLKLDHGHAEIIALTDPLEGDLIQGVMKGLAALAAINSPSARMAGIDSHRGFEKIMRAHGVKTAPSIVHTRVTIGRWSEGHATGAHPAHPKAYHFCRAHVRIKRGKVEQVRAHWRGDPAFGVRLPSYTVKPALIEEDRG